MSNMTTTDCDIGALELTECQHMDGLLVFGGAGTMVKGTILARDSVSLKFVKFVKGGSSNENGIPKAVLPDDVTATGAGDVKVRAIVSGQVRKERLVIDADGDDSNIDAKVVDQLRDYHIVAVNTQQLDGELLTDEDS